MGDLDRIGQLVLRFNCEMSCMATTHLYTQGPQNKRMRYWLVCNFCQELTLSILGISHRLPPGKHWPEILRTEVLNEEML